MDYIATEVISSIHVISYVANFLANTGRSLQAIALCNECLIILTNFTEWLKEDQQLTAFYDVIYLVLFKAYNNKNDFTNAERYARKLIAMSHDSGDTRMEGILTFALADIYQKQSRLVEAKELYERAIDIIRANGNRELEATPYLNLGAAFSKLGEYEKTAECVEKALLVSKEIGDRKGEAECYSALGSLCEMLGKYRAANDYFQNARCIWVEIGGGKEDEAHYYTNQAKLSSSLGDHRKAEEYLKKALEIILETGDRENEAQVYHRLGFVSLNRNEHVKAEEYYEKARFLSSEIGDNQTEFISLLGLTVLKFLQSNAQEVNSHLLSCIQKFENLRIFNNDSDQTKISLLESRSPYQLLSALLLYTANTQTALYVEELGRARALADLLTAQYGVENHISDIANVHLRAKLVVLSCCHSGRGQINKEGVVGIARAFLGSGARSVLVALWALGDTATEQFMSRFYEHLVCGESANEALHQAMKWMRSNRFCEVSEWAPFMLVGDNVTFHLSNKGLKPLSAKESKD